MEQAGSQAAWQSKRDLSIYLLACFISSTSQDCLISIQDMRLQANMMRLVSWYLAYMSVYHSREREGE